MDISAYVTGVTTNITNKIDPKSIPATIVGNALTDLANLTKTSVDVNNTSIANLSAATLNFISKSTDLSYKVTSKQLFDKSTFRNDTSILSNGALSVVAGSSAQTTNDLLIDSSQTQITVSGLFSGGTHRPAFLNSAQTVITPVPANFGATTTLTIPSGATYFRVNFKTTIETDSTLKDRLMINYGSVALPYESYKQTTTTIANNDIAASNLIINNQLVSSNNIVVKSGDLRVYVSTTANQWYVRIPFNSTYDLIHIWALDPLNIIPEYTKVMKVPSSYQDDESYFTGTPSGTGQIHAPNDDISPFRLDDGYDIGGGHGFDVKSVTLATHGKTLADTTSQWTDGTCNWYLVDVPDVNTLKFVGKKTSNANGFYVSSSFHSNTLTHVSGATNTTSIDITSNTSIQAGPVTKNTTYQLFLDGAVIAASGLYYGKIFKIVDTHRIIDPRAVTIQYPFVTNVGGDLVENIICYSYDKTNTCTVDHTTNFLSQFFIPYYSFVQGLRAITSFESASTTLLYIPNTTNISNGTTTYNLTTTPANIFNPLGGNSLIYGSGNTFDNTKAVNRFVEIEQTSTGIRKNGYAMTFSPSIGVGKDSNRKGFTEQLEVRGNSAKIYPRGIYNYSANNDVIQCRIYRSYFDSTLNPNATAVYCYNENGSYFLYIDYHQTVTKEKVFLPDFLKGKALAVVDTGGSFTLHTNNYIPDSAELLISVTTYGYIVLKLTN